MPPLPRVPHRVAVPALLLAFAVSAAASMWNDSATFDETAHLGAGVSYLERGDFRLNPEHPPLAKVWAALPLVALSRGGGDYASDAWRGEADTAGRRTEANEWIFGFELLNGPRAAASRRDPAARLRPARLAMIVLGAALCLAVYGWSREMFGRGPGLAGLLLAATCPTILAHARLVTTDLPAALGTTLVLWSFWRWDRKPSSARAAALGVAFGAALLLKFSCTVLVPAVGLLGAASVALRRVPAGRAAASAAVVAAVAWTAIWAGYGFRYAASTDPGYVLDWPALEGERPGVPAAVSFAARHHLVPEAYAYGLAYARAWATDRVGFLDGEISKDGWYRYFPEAFLFKTRPAFIALVVWVVAAAAWKVRGRSWDGWVLAFPALVAGGLAIVSRFNIGHRHSAPLYPILCIAASPAANWLGERGRRGVVVAALLAGCIASYAAATPYYLSYFNLLAGGARGGWRHLVDSNVDWGQDLGRLAELLRARGIGTVDLAYFGTADPRAYGIDFRKTAMFLDTYADRPPVRPKPGDYLAASVTMLQGVYLDRDRAFAREAAARGWIGRAQFESYLERADALRRRGEPAPDLATWLVAERYIDDDQRRAIEEQMPAHWMELVRTRMTPIARAGRSIFVYRVGLDGPF